MFKLGQREFGWVSRVAFSAGTKHVQTLGDDRPGTLLDRAGYHGDQQTRAVVDADEFAAILYTSGTTGRSKGATLTHRNLLSNTQVLDVAWGWAEARAAGRPDALTSALPIFHVHRVFVAIHGALLSGSKMIWFGKFDPRATVARLPKATVFMGVPTL